MISVEPASQRFSRGELTLTDEKEEPEHPMWGNYMLVWITLSFLVAVDEPGNPKEETVSGWVSVEEYRIKPKCDDCGGTLRPRPAPAPEILPKLVVPKEAVKPKVRSVPASASSAENPSTVQTQKKPSAEIEQVAYADDQRRGIFPWQRSQRNSEQAQPPRKPWWKRMFSRRDQDDQQPDQRNGQPNQNQNQTSRPSNLPKQPPASPSRNLTGQNPAMQTPPPKAPADLPGQPGPLPLPTLPPVMTPLKEIPTEPKLPLQLPVLPSQGQGQPTPAKNSKPPVTPPAHSGSGLVDIPTDGPELPKLPRLSSQPSAEVKRIDYRKIEPPKKRTTPSMLRDASVWTFTPEKKPTQAEQHHSETKSHDRSADELNDSAVTPAKHEFVSNVSTRRLERNHRAEDSSRARSEQSFQGIVRRSPVSGGVWLLRDERGQEWALDCDARLLNRLKEGEKIEVHGKPAEGNTGPLGITCLMVNKVSLWSGSH
jgi:hypothetical protein